MLDCAKAALDEAGAKYDVVTKVPRAGNFTGRDLLRARCPPRGGHLTMMVMVALGTSSAASTHHFDIVATAAARALMDMSVQESLCIGNGIVPLQGMYEQAWTRAGAGRRQGWLCSRVRTSPWIRREETAWSLTA
ncbi:6,7-dimethyl-8-ribityllumazine synthase [Mesorhizobium calcicola]|uniref:6,7-dimethyl-8-ribityllumazine synthase n=1 Tax=Mesorhizobium calcicola TaxID=1300310 RepID=A0ABW4W6R6_9HYPH